MPDLQLLQRTQTNTLRKVLMMKNSLKLITSIALVSLGACSTIDKTDVITSFNEDRPCYFPNMGKEEAPKWVCPDKLANTNHITGLGVYEGSDSSYNLAFQIAQQRARVNLAQALTVSLSSKSDDFSATTKTKDGETLDARAETVSRSEVAKILRGSRVYSSITDSNSTLYVLVGIDEKLARSKHARGIQSSYKNAEVSYIKQEASEALNDLERE
jgi:hypothetical protein